MNKVKELLAKLKQLVLELVSYFSPPVSNPILNLEGLRSLEEPRPVASLVDHGTPQNFKYEVIAEVVIPKKKAKRKAKKKPAKKAKKKK